MFLISQFTTFAGNIKLNDRIQYSMFLLVHILVRAGYIRNNRNIDSGFIMKAFLCFISYGSEKDVTYSDNYVT